MNKVRINLLPKINPVNRLRKPLTIISLVGLLLQTTFAWVPAYAQEVAVDTAAARTDQTVSPTTNVLDTSVQPASTLDITTTTWPADNQWTIPVCSADQVGDKSPSSVDLVGSGSAYGAAYFTDANNLYVRERVVGNPGTPGNLDQYAWVLMIQDNIATSNYDYLVSLRGSGQGENVELWQNTTQNGPINWSPIFNDPAEQRLATWSTLTNSRVTHVGSYYLVDWQIPLSALQGVDLLNSGLYFATSTNANNYNKDHLDCYNAPDVHIAKQIQKNHAGPWFEDGRTAGIQADPGDTLTYRVTLSNAGGPATNQTVVDELGHGLAADGSANIDPAAQYSNWMSVKNFDSDGNTNAFTGSWGNGTADGQSNDTLTTQLALLSGGGASESFTFDTTVRTDMAAGTYLFENLATDTTVPTNPQQAETDISVTQTVRTGTLRVIKNVVGGQNVAADWQMHVKQDNVDVSGSPQAGSPTGTDYTLPIGTYNISETGPADYSATFSASCANGQATVTAGQITTCAVTNTRNTGLLTVIKQVVNDNGGNAAVADFPLFVGKTQVSSGAQNEFATGAYVVSETNKAGYDATISGDCDANGNVRLDSGDVKTCIITNDDVAPTITLVKSVINDNGGTAGANDFGLTIGGSAVNSGQKLVVNANTSYALNEAGRAGYAFVSLSGDEGCPKVLGGTVRLDEGEDITCTITNTAIASGINLVKTGPTTVTAGGNYTYTITWSVIGDNPVTNAVITDPLPANTTFVSAACGTTAGTCTMNTATATISWALGTRDPHMASDKTGTVTLTVKAASPITDGTLINNTAAFDTDQTPPVTSVWPTIVRSAPALTITKTSNVTTFTNPGLFVTYTVTVANAASATDTARSIVLKDVLPTDFTFDDSSTSKTFAAFDLKPGESKTFTLNALVGATVPSGKYTNTATAKGDNTSEVKATADVEVRIPTVLGQSAEPKLVITKEVNTKFTNPGKTVRYLVTVENTGNVTAQNVVIADTLPKGFTFVDGGKQKKVFQLGDLEPGHKRSINYEVLVSKSVKPGTYDNLAIAQADNVGPVSATVPLEVRKAEVLAATGTAVLDYLMAFFALMTLAAGIALTTRQKPLALDKNR